MSSRRSRATWVNWAGNQTARPADWVEVRSAEEVHAAVGSARAAGRHVKAVGSGHSFTGAAVANDVLVDLSGLTRVGTVMGTDSHVREGLSRAEGLSGEVDVDAGVTISQLNENLLQQGWALQNMGDITAQTISGAISTSTHGTGLRYQGLAAQVCAVSLVDGNGISRRLSPSDGEAFRSAQVGVGSLGVITSVRLKVVPAFSLAAVERPMRLEAVLANIDSLVEENDHFEFYWIPHTRWALTKSNNRHEGRIEPLARHRHWWQKSFLENTAFGAVCRIGSRFPTLIPRLATALPSSGSVSYSDVSHRVFATTRRVKFVEMEYSIRREACVEAIDRLTQMIEKKGFRISFPVEVRFSAPDDALLSTSFDRESAYVAVHMYRGMEYEAYFREVESIMTAYGGRPHWGKIHYLEAEDLGSRYPAWEKFLSVRRNFDPDGLFLNDYTRRVFGVSN